MSGSNYAWGSADWNSPETVSASSTELICHRCHGSGQDRDGADCVYCYGFGSVITDPIE